MSETAIIGGAPRTEYLKEVAEGRVGSQEWIVIPGRRDGISNMLLDDICQFPIASGVIPNPGGVGLEVISTSVNDTSAGTGAQTIHLTYLDTSGDQQEETIVMNGQTRVLTSATDIDKVQWMHVRTIGNIAAQTAIGDIFLRAIDASDNTAPFEKITAGGNQSLTCKYTVPTGKKALIRSWHYTGITKQIDFRLRINVDRDDRTTLITPFLFQDVGVSIDSSSPESPPNLTIPAGATIKVSALSAASGGNGSATFFVLQENA